MLCPGCSHPNFADVGLGLGQFFADFDEKIQQRRIGEELEVEVRVGLLFFNAVDLLVQGFNFALNDPGFMVKAMSKTLLD